MPGVDTLMQCDCGAEMVHGEIEVLSPQVRRDVRVLVSGVPARICRACGARVVAPEVAAVVAALQAQEVRYGGRDDIRGVTFRWEVVEEKKAAKTPLQLTLPPITLTMGEIAHRFGISVNEIRELRDSGALQWEQVGRSKRIRADCIRPAVAAGVLPRPADWLSDEEYEAKLAEWRGGK